MNSEYSFKEFDNVEISGIKIDSLTEEEKALLYQQARYCQAMTEADTETMRQIVSKDMVFVHMNGRTQSREEYFADIEKGLLVYYTIGIESPVISINENKASFTYTSVLNANAYGARGTFRMKGTHHYEKINDQWIMVNG